MFNKNKDFDKYGYPILNFSNKNFKPFHGDIYNDNISIEETSVQKMVDNPTYNYVTEEESATSPESSISTSKA